MSDPIQTRLQEAIRLTTEALNMYSAPVISVSRGASLQVAIDKAPDGATLSIEPGVYQGSLNIPKPLTMMTSVLLPPGRVSSLTPMVTVIGSQAADAISVPGSRVSMQGIGASSPDPSRQLVGVTGSQFSMKQCSLVGDTNSGQHRGLMLNGDTALIGDCFIDNCFSVGRDAQAIGGWDGTKNITIDNCYLGGGGQSVMWGGADSTSSDRIPTNIAITDAPESDIDYPPGHELSFPFADRPIRVYTGRTTIPVQFRAPVAKGQSIRVMVTYQPCDAAACLPVVGSSLLVKCDFDQAEGQNGPG